MLSTGTARGHPHQQWLQRADSCVCGAEFRVANSVGDMNDLEALSAAGTMSKQQCETQLAHCYDTDGNALFSDKVISRLTAMSAFTDCWLVSTDGTAYPVHKVKLLEQSQVLGQVRAERQLFRGRYMSPHAHAVHVQCTPRTTHAGELHKSRFSRKRVLSVYVDSGAGAYFPTSQPHPSCSLMRPRPASASSSAACMIQTARSIGPISHLFWS